MPYQPRPASPGEARPGLATFFSFSFYFQFSSKSAHSRISTTTSGGRPTPWTPAIFSSKISLTTGRGRTLSFWREPRGNLPGGLAMWSCPTHTPGSISPTLTVTFRSSSDLSTAQRTWCSPSRLAGQSVISSKPAGCQPSHHE